MRKKRQADRLLQKYRKGQCTEEEKRLLLDWYETWNNEELPLSEEDFDLAEQEMWRAIQKKPAKELKKNPYFKWMIAAGIMLATFFALYQSHIKQSSSNLENRLFVHDVNPGDDRASLTLSDGSQVNLTALKPGESIEQNGFQILKKADGQLVYTAKVEENRNKQEVTVAFNEIHTPKGGQFQLQLPDGTNVWLNASSSIRYPLYFDKGERRVELAGEAYFEVSKQPHLSPFIVQTNRQEIFVLGTHFNVNAYENELATKTTLLEGKVKVSTKGHTSSVVLQPNEQSSFPRNGTQFNVRQVDPTESIAWKEGNFVFNNTDLKTIIRQLERWYDVKAVDLDNFPNNTYNGKMKRAVKLSKVLRILELTSGLKFAIEEETTAGKEKRIRLIK
jgi:ferric-dicitrate binding protein FerR (iron transport regulator)